MKGNKNPIGRVALILQKLTSEQIQEWARKLNNEEDVLRSLGQNKGQIERAKQYKKWRTNWDIGYAQGLIAKNEELFHSDESSIQKLYAEKVMPEQFDSDVVIHWKAPKWFYESFDSSKVKKVRKKVVD